jgi:hypothetical protein
MFQLLMSSEFYLCLDFVELLVFKISCIVPSGKYFQQIITFTRSVSIHIQIAFGKKKMFYEKLYFYFLL